MISIIGKRIIPSILSLFIITSQINNVTSFTTNTAIGRKPSLIGSRRSSPIVPPGVGRKIQIKNTALHMAKSKGKKKRRKRKNAPQDQNEQQPTTASAPLNTIIPEDDMEAAKELSQSGSQASIDELKAIANFQGPSGGSNIGLDGPAPPVSPPPTDAGGADSENLVDLPDIRNVLKNKELKRIEQEEAQKQQRPKISRKDTKAFLELLESEPFADADDSYFEDEEYGTVSALLAEGAKSFLGIPPGPLQVGHFIGSLVIFLCAFIEYPGFPLTNLPTPLRDALQGGKCVHCESWSN